MGSAHPPGVRSEILLSAWRSPKIVMLMMLVHLIRSGHYRVMAIEMCAGRPRAGCRAACFFVPCLDVVAFSTPPASRLPTPLLCAHGNVHLLATCNSVNWVCQTATWVRVPAQDTVDCTNAATLCSDADCCMEGTSERRESRAVASSHRRS